MDINKLVTDRQIAKLLSALVAECVQRNTTDAERLWDTRRAMAQMATINKRLETMRRDGIYTDN